MKVLSFLSAKFYFIIILILTNEVITPPPLIGGYKREKIEKNNELQGKFVRFLESEIEERYKDARIYSIILYKQITRTVKYKLVYISKNKNYTFDMGVAQLSLYHPYDYDTEKIKYKEIILDSFGKVDLYNYKNENIVNEMKRIISNIMRIDESEIIIYNPYGYEIGGDIIYLGHFAVSRGDLGPTVTVFLDENKKGKLELLHYEVN